MVKKTVLLFALAAVLAPGAAFAEQAQPLATPAVAADCAAVATLAVESAGDLDVQKVDNRPFGPLGPPPAAPGNACEAQCVADFFQCQRICSRNPCLVSCEFLFDLCVAGC